VTPPINLYIIKNLSLFKVVLWKRL